MDSVSIKLSIGNVVISTHPIFGDDVKLKITQEENQIFYRTKIDGKVIFSGEDFDFIDGCNDEVEFTLSVYRGSTLIGSGTFIKPDCTLDYDAKTCEVHLTTTDRYETILANLDNKYNLVKLAPKIESVLLVKRPILQFFALGDTKITNVFGNMAFEVDAINSSENKTDAQLQNLGFTNVLHKLMCTIEGSGSYIPSAAEGEYNGTYNSTMSSIVLTNENGYQLKYYNSSQAGVEFALYDEDDVLVTVGGVGHIGFITQDITVFTAFYKKVTLYAKLPYTTPTAGTAVFESRSIYGRLLIDKSESPSGWADSPIAISSLSNDIYDNANSNYTYVCGISSFGGIYDVITTDTMTTDPTEFYNGNGQYYVKPNPYTTHGVVYPIGQSMWGALAFWYNSRATYAKQLDEDFGVYYTLKDAFPLYSAIQVLLAEVAPDVTFDPTLSIHEFFREDYTTATLRKMASAYIPSPRSRGARLYITPITNVKKTRYEQAAQRGDITLKQITDMLRNLYGCYWWVDDNNRFRIEHISYFKHNNAYLLGEPEADIDVTAMTDMPNKLSWAFGTSKIEHDRNRCPSRYEFSWGDTCTEQFNGYAIDIEDKFADGDVKEKVAVNNFIADIDYAVISPNTVSDDVYCLIESNLAWGGTEIPLVGIGDSFSDPWFYVQNGYCSFLFAEQNYLNHDLGGWKAVANGVSLDVKGVRQYRKQDILFPMPLAKIADIGAVKTEMGIGLIKEQEINADTLMAKSKIVLEGERDYSSLISIYKQGVGPHGTSRWVARNLDSTNYLTLIYYGSESYGSTPWDDNCVHTVTIAPNTTVELGYYYTVIALSVRLGGNLQFGEFVKLGMGDMSLDDFSNYHSGATFTLNGNSGTAYDWCYISLYCAQRTRINLTASSESAYDFGYVSHLPIVDSTDVGDNALEFVSGTGTAQYIASAGETVYIGYSKDVNNIANNDTIEIEIEVPE